MTLEEMRILAGNLAGSEAEGAKEIGPVNVSLLREVLRDAIAYREMMTERKHSELVVGKTYFVRNLLIGSWVAMLYDGDNKDVVDFCKDTMQLLGPIPMPEVTR